MTVWIVFALMGLVAVLEAVGRRKPASGNPFEPSISRWDVPGLVEIVVLDVAGVAATGYLLV